MTFLSMHSIIMFITAVLTSAPCPMSNSAICISNEEISFISILDLSAGTLIIILVYEEEMTLPEK